MRLASNIQVKKICNSDHIKDTLDPLPKLEPQICNCVNKMSCFLTEQCLLGDVLNQATIARTDSMKQNKVYCRICETTLQNDMKTIANRSTLINIDVTRNCPTNFRI